MELAQNEFTGGIETAIEKNRAQKRFKSIRQRGRAFTSAVKFFASAENEMISQAELARVLSERAAIDQFGACLRQRPLPEGRKILVEFASQNELQDGITEEFQALVGLHGNALFVCDGGMSQ